MLHSCGIKPLAYASCPECNVTFQVNAIDLKEIECQHCGGAVSWLVPPAPVPVEDIDTPISTAPSMSKPDFPSELIDTPISTAPSMSKPDFPSELEDTVEVTHVDASEEPTTQVNTPTPSERVRAPMEDSRSVAPSAAPSEDRSTRRIDFGTSSVDDETSGLFNKPVPSLPRLNAPGSTADVVPDEEPNEGDTIADHEVSERIRALSLREEEQVPSAEVESTPPVRMVLIFVISILVGALAALILR
jgi:hypothetical protein